MVEDSTKTDDSVRAEHAELYAAYCEFKTDGVRSLLSGESDPETVRKIRNLGRTMGREEFLGRLLTLSRRPSQYQEFRETILAGWREPNARGI